VAAATATAEGAFIPDPGGRTLVFGGLSLDEAEGKPAFGPLAVGVLAFLA
jgi:hypothetical protein